MPLRKSLRRQSVDFSVDQPSLPAWSIERKIEGAMGPGVVWNRGQWFLFANRYQEFGTENRTTGHNLVL
jgi:hypothetical protein